MTGGATWLITGGTGFFGHYFTRYLLDHADPHAIRIVSRSEARQAAMAQQFPDSRLRFLIGDVRDADRLHYAFRDVDVVVHAAALKRVDTCETEPWEAVATNIMGSRNVAAACIDAGVQRAVLLSTDKAPSPDTTYGATKLVAERLWTQSNVYAAGTRTRFAVTRYGNVLGSTGSVVTTWHRQMLTGANMITVTDPHATRFWMTPHDACVLVWTAVAVMEGGEIFVPPLKAASLETLAQAIAPGVRYQVTGLRPAEKRHEILLTDEERSRTVSRHGVFVVAPRLATWTNTVGPPAGEPVTGVYRSDAVAQWTVDELREAVAQCESLV